MLIYSQELLVHFTYSTRLKIVYGSGGGVIPPFSSSKPRVCTPVFDACGNGKWFIC